MDKTIKEIRERHKKEIEEFQKKCPHLKISRWIEEWWGMAHSTGFQVKVCLRCNKVIERRKKKIRKRDQSPGYVK